MIIICVVTVAPFAGAWIEINHYRFSLNDSLVAPFAGAWIEIVSDFSAHGATAVAPFAGAWIEMFKVKSLSDLTVGRSLRGSVD